MMQRAGEIAGALFLCKAKGVELCPKEDLASSRCQKSSPRALGGADAGECSEGLVGTEDSLF